MPTFYAWCFKLSVFITVIIKIMISFIGCLVLINNDEPCTRNNERFESISTCHTYPFDANR